MNFYRKKLLNAILFFAKNTENPTLTKTFKLLFFLDFKHFEETGYPSIGLDYFAFHWGPVPKSLWLELKDGNVPDDFKGMFKLQELGREDESMLKGKLIKTSKNPDMSCFSPREAKLLENLAFIYKEVNSELISEISHLKNQPWELTLRSSGENSLINYLIALRDKPEDERELAKEKLSEYFAVLQNFSLQY